MGQQYMEFLYILSVLHAIYVAYMKNRSIIFCMLLATWFPVIGWFIVVYVLEDFGDKGYSARQKKIF